ncbi:MAG: N-acetyl-gamma-glutamyl-phosphate reductase [Nitrospirota bacterium]
MLKVAIIGASGYTGAELLRLLAQHPQVKITAVTSERSAGKSVAGMFPNLRDCNLIFEPLKIKNLGNKADLFFLCLPHKTSQEAVAFLYKSGKRVIDLSADYRLKDKKIYEKWYENRHMFPSLLKEAVYGLPELYREKIKRAGIIANPGCYPASAILGLAPVMGKSFIDSGTIIIDSKSGISGAGRNPSQPFMFSEANESVKAYAVTTHRHTPEIEQELSLLSKKNIKIVFTPHLIPMDRGILSTIYVRLSAKGGSASGGKEKINLPEVQKAYQDFYYKEPFVRVLENGVYPTIKAVKGSNYCDISVFLDKRNPKTLTLIILSAIDNLLKGASGQAVQNMNIMCGFDETSGLTALPAFP